MLTGDIRILCQDFLLFIIDVPRKELMEEYKIFYNYKVYSDGRVYSMFTHKFLKGEINKYGYLVYTLAINQKPVRIRANRLVAFLFLKVPKNYKELVVNHKDGVKLNNNYTNLAWSTYYENNLHARQNKLNNISESNRKRWEDQEFRKRVSKKISQTQRKTQCSKREKNGRYKYKIHDKNDKVLYRDELPKLLNLSQSTIDRLIRETAQGQTNKYFQQYGISIQIIKSKVNRLSKA